MDAANNDDIIAELKNRLFDIAQYWSNKNALRESVKVLRSILGCTECSLWSLNHNSTHEEKKDFISTSLICRELSVSYIFNSKTDYVNDLNEGFFQRIINTTDVKSEPVFRFSKDEAISCVHKSKNFVEDVGPNDFFIIPIYKKKESRFIIALLEISYKKYDLDDSIMEILSAIVSPFISTTFNHVFFVQKQIMMESLIMNHRKYKNESVEVLFENIMKSLLTFCPAQGASFFIWDDYRNQYNLVSTTGLEGSPKFSDVYYQKGEGRTGQIGLTGKPLIIDDLKKKDDNAKNDLKDPKKGKFCEELRDSAMTEMYIPIINPSDKSVVIGIFRLVNKKNICNDRFVDYFSDTDVEMMMYAADYLSLIIANYQKEESQYNFIDKLTHEIVTPANAILKSANRLYIHLGNQEFLSKNLPPYLKNIIDFAELQRWQADTNLFLSRNRRKQPFEVRYSIKPILLHSVIKESIDIVIPIARKYKVKFDNIVINPRSDPQLIVRIDKNAFLMVFYNLFTNAIKYHDPRVPKEQFFIGISYTMEEKYLVIEVADNGIGINQDEKDSIFGIGYRSNSAMRINASGYGIGLTVIRQIVKDFGGTISIAHFRKPTVFQITIPLEKIL